MCFQCKFVVRDTGTPARPKVGQKVRQEAQQSAVAHFLQQQSFAAPAYKQRADYTSTATRRIVNEVASMLSVRLARQSE
jgi:uncharacterized membrane protein